MFLPQFLPYGSYGNASQPANFNLPSSVIDNVLPGYSHTSRYASTLLSFRISFVFTSIALLFGAIRAGKFFYRELTSTIGPYFLCTLVMPENGKVFEIVME